MKTKNYFKANLKYVSICLMFFLMSSISAQNLIPNGNFETWKPLVEDPASGLQKGFADLWGFVKMPDSEMAAYQSLETPTGTGFSLFVCNATANKMRFFTPLTPTLTLGNYKLSFKTRGSISWDCIAMSESSYSLGGAGAYSVESPKNRFPVTGIVNEVVPDGSTAWVTKEYEFSVVLEGAYRVVFFMHGTKPAVLDNVNDYFLMNDVSLVKEEESAVNNPSMIDIKLYPSKGKLNFQTEKTVKYSLKTITGATLRSGSGSNVSMDLPQGLYLLDTNGAINKVLIP